MDASSRSRADTSKQSDQGAPPSPWKPTQPLFQGDPNADVILQSRDGFEFRVQKNILVIVSPLFRDMFSVGGPSERVPTEGTTQIPELRVVPMLEETGDVVEKLLQLCYPGPLEPPMWSGATDVYPVLAAAIKYQVEGVVGVLRKALVSRKFLEEEPLRVFAMACRARLQEEARTAAQQKDPR